MTDDQLVKVIQKAVKDEVRPLKEQVEVVKSKISHLDLYTSTTSSNVRLMKEQQSVMNEKLDGIEDVKGDLDVVKQDTGIVKEQLSDLNDIIGNRIYPSVVEIEKNITSYADMYKINNDNSKKLEKRLGVVEDKLDLHPDSAFPLLEVA